MNVQELLRIEDKLTGEWNVTYRYWVKGECACTGIKINRTFKNNPNNQDLINAI